MKPSMLVESLVPGFRGDPECVERVATSLLDVFAHNIENVEELQCSVRDRRANFKQSLDVLRLAKKYAPPGTLTKTSIMLGCDEAPAQGFRYVASRPMVRSSYKVGEYLIKSMIDEDRERQ